MHQAPEIVTVVRTDENGSTEYAIPQTIWDSELLERHIDSVAQLSLQTQYLQRTVISGDEPYKALAHYRLVNFTSDQVTAALDNVRDPAIVMRALSALVTSQFQLLIVGPPAVANMFARSLAAVLPPGLRRRVLYAGYDSVGARCCQKSEEAVLRDSALPKGGKPRLRLSVETSQQSAS